MLPVELMDLKPKDFKVYNNLIKNKHFIKSLILNVGSIFYFSKKKFNSVIINYDENLKIYLNGISNLLLKV